MALTIEPSCVGRFFPSGADELRERVALFLAEAARLGSAEQDAGRPKAIIVPHAAYDYSGPVAAAGNATLARHADSIRRVVVLGTCHVRRARGLLTTTADAIVTPLGRVAVDPATVEQLVRSPLVSVDNEAHRADHAVAVQLPLLQVTLGEFLIVPLLVGICEPADVAELLELAWGGDETLVVVSSDLSHQLSYGEATRRDRQTADAITRLDAAAIGRSDACGHRAIAGLLLAAKRHRLWAREVEVRNSGDVAGGRDCVVGYGAFAFEIKRVTA